MRTRLSVYGPRAAVEAAEIPKYHTSSDKPRSRRRAEGQRPLPPRSHPGRPYEPLIRVAYPSRQSLSASLSLFPPFPPSLRTSFPSLPRLSLSLSPCVYTLSVCFPLSLSIFSRPPDTPFQSQPSPLTQGLGSVHGSVGGSNDSSGDTRKILARICARTPTYTPLTGTGVWDTDARTHASTRTCLTRTHTRVATRT